MTVYYHNRSLWASPENCIQEFEVTRVTKNNVWISLSGSSEVMRRRRTDSGRYYDSLEDCVKRAIKWERSLLYRKTEALAGMMRTLAVLESPDFAASKLDTLPAGAERGDHSPGFVWMLEKETAQIALVRVIRTTKSSIWTPADERRRRNTADLAYYNNLSECIRAATAHLRKRANGIDWTKELVSLSQQRLRYMEAILAESVTGEKKTE